METKTVMMDGKPITLIQSLSEEEMDDFLLDEYEDEKTRDLSNDLEKTREFIGDNGE